MIFVTVGTHEQPFDRLLKEIDRLKGEGIIEDEVFIQSGYTDYEPQNCEWSKLIPAKEMENKINEARIVITHGGPASFIAPLQKGKIPIVVPRQFEFGEHVNNHQLEFAKNVEERNKNIIPVYDIADLENKIVHYDEIVSKMNLGNLSNNQKFCKDFENIVKELVG